MVRARQTRMATTKSRPGLRVTALVMALAGLGCESEPCIGPGCPSRCIDPTCEDGSGATAAAAGGGGAVGGASGTGGSSGTGAAGGSNARGGTGGTGVSSGGRFTPCTRDASCDTAHGFSCVEGECRHPCRSHFDCVGTGTCAPLAATGQTYCAPFEAPLPAGGYYTTCPGGTECTQPGFLCLGAGVGDLDAYCSGTCAADGDCPAGFLCDRVRGANDQPEDRCVRRSFCHSCETDADCLGLPDRVCARDASGEKICTQRCELGIVSCPWGNASECGMFDAELGVPTCSHRFGSCRGSGKSCEPCTRSSDCGAGICNRSSFTEERWCVDVRVECDCAGLPMEGGVCGGANGCPRSPGGVAMLCYDDPADQQNSAARRCFAGDPIASFGASPQLGCWNPQ
jgi:hypothetical protein